MKNFIALYFLIVLNLFSMNEKPCWEGTAFACSADRLVSVYVKLSLNKMLFAEREGNFDLNLTSDDFLTDLNDLKRLYLSRAKEALPPENYTIFENKCTSEARIKSQKFDVQRELINKIFGMQKALIFNLFEYPSSESFSKVPFNGGLFNASFMEIVPEHIKGKTLSFEKYNQKICSYFFESLSLTNKYKNDHTDLKSSTNFCALLLQVLLEFYNWDRFLDSLFSERDSDTLMDSIPELMEAARKECEGWAIDYIKKSASSWKPSGYFQNVIKGYEMNEAFKDDGIFHRYY